VNYYSKNEILMDKDCVSQKHLTNFKCL